MLLLLPLRLLLLPLRAALWQRAHAADAQLAGVHLLERRQPRARRLQAGALVLYPAAVLAALRLLRQLLGA